MYAVQKQRLDRVVVELKKLKIYKGDNSVFQQKYSYELMEPYGIGSFGTVIRGKERDSNKDVAIKQVPNQINDLHSDIISDLFIQELQNLDLFQGKHPCILSCEGIYTRESITDGISTTKIMMIFPPAEKSLYDLYQDKNEKLSEDEVYDIVEQVLNALNYLVRKFKLQHRDIKLSNILYIKKGHIALTDFGISKVKNGEFTQDANKLQNSIVNFGSTGYWPREVLIYARGDKNQKIDGQKSDIFGLGIVALLLIDKQLVNTTLTELKDGFIEIQKQIDKIKSQKLKSLLTGMLEKEVDKRFDSFQALQNIYTNENPQILPSAVQKKEIKVLKWELGTYEGEVVDEKANGQGKYVQEKGEGKGSIYEGEWVNNKKEGYGKTTFNNGDIHEGEYKKGAYEGQGKYSWKSGSKFEGLYKNDKREGNGKYIRFDGEIYEGEFKNDNKHGFGEQLYKNGDKYVGTFENDKLQGEGIYIYSDGKQEKRIYVQGIQQK